MNHLLIILFFSFTFIGTSCGQKPKEKTSEEIVTTKTVGSEHSLEDTAFLRVIPIKAPGWVSDYEHIFSDSQISELDSMISKFEKETTIEIAIVTINSFRATPKNFDSLTLAIARNWGVGKKDKNNGILIGISTGLKKIRIQNGYGIEKKLSDAETKKIMDENILPEFKNGNFFEGTRNGLLELMKKLR